MITGLLPSAIIAEGVHYYLMLEEVSDGICVQYVNGSTVLIICTLSNMIPTKEDYQILRNVFSNLRTLSVVLVDANYSLTLQEFLGRLNKYESDMFARG